VFSGTGGTGAQYLQLLRSANSRCIEDVLEYHSRLMQDHAAVTRSMAYLVHDNETFPQKIYYPKALQILSVSKNVGAGSDYRKLLAKHTVLTKDPFFVAWGY
jgi:hypothetical protein